MEGIYQIVSHLTFLLILYLEEEFTQSQFSGHCLHVSGEGLGKEGEEYYESLA